MGYSLSIRVKSDQCRYKFLKFMQANFRHWSIVCGKEHSRWHGSASDLTDDISYGKTKTSIGFDYQSGMRGFERDYLYSVVRWMALKVGDRKKRMVVDETDNGYMIHQFSEPTPYYIYDGEPVLNPLLVVTEDQAIAFPKNLCQWAIDEWGVRVGPTAVYSRIGSCSGLIGEHRAAINEELKAIGSHPPEDKAGEEEWFGKRLEVYLKYLSNEMDENVNLIRQEIQRLDRLWAGKA
jgi:hypothetical protein